ncbi:hypothetical protein GCM10009412_34450 [Aeromonas salmonicida subsp. achromogenes]
MEEGATKGQAIEPGHFWGDFTQTSLWFTVGTWSSSMLTHGLTVPAMGLALPTFIMRLIKWKKLQPGRCWY